MHNKKNQRRVKQIQCEPLSIVPGCRKKRYGTHGRALIAMHAIYKVNTAAKSRRGKMDVYFCTTCDGWHFGHVRPWEKGKKRSRGEAK